MPDIQKSSNHIEQKTEHSPDSVQDSWVTRPIISIKQYKTPNGSTHFYTKVVNITAELTLFQSICLYSLTVMVALF